MSRRPAAPPLWVLALPLKPGPKLLLIALWGFASYDAATEPESVRVWPTRKTLSETLGTPLGTLKRWLADLVEAGLVQRDGIGWLLASQSERFAVNADGPTDEPTRPADEPTRPADEPLWPTDEPAQLRATPGPDMSRPGPTTGHQWPTDEPQKLTGTSKEPSIEPSRSSTRACVADAAIDSVLLDRHREHAERQTRLEAEREANRAEQRKRAARSELSAEIIAAVGEAGALWVRELETGRSDGRPTWLDDLASAVVELRLSAADVLRVLRAWDEAEAALGGPLAVARLPATGGVMPPRRGVWWTAWRPWVAAQLGAEAPAARQREHGRGSLSVGWPSNTTSSRRSFVKPKEVAQA